MLKALIPLFILLVACSPTPDNPIVEFNGVDRIGGFQIETQITITQDMTYWETLIRSDE